MRPEQAAGAEANAPRQAGLLALSNDALERMVRGESLITVLNRFALGVEQLCPQMLVSVLLLDEAGQHLNHGVAPSLAPAYVRAIDGLEIGPCQGSCGTAAFTGQAVLVNDIAHDPLWANFASLAAQHGLAACWSRPIVSNTGVSLGTFAGYARSARVPTDMELQALDTASALAAVAVEHERVHVRLNQQLQELQRRHDAMMGRENRVLELKREVNALLKDQGLAPRYTSVLPLTATGADEASCEPGAALGKGRR